MRSFGSINFFRFEMLSLVKKRLLKTFSGHLMRIVVFAVLLDAFFTRDAFAYLDAGTGSYIIQIIIAVFIGAITAVKIF